MITATVSFYMPYLMESCENKFENSYQLILLIYIIQ